MADRNEVRASLRGEIGYSLVDGQWIPHPIESAQVPYKKITPRQLPLGVYRGYVATVFTVEDALERFIDEEHTDPLMVFETESTIGTRTLYVTADPDVVYRWEFNNG